MKLKYWLLVIIFLEGYSVLSVEILAIRQLIPFVGNGLESLSIIISAVLIPLSFGYYFGGNYNGLIRKKLTRNLLQAGFLLILCLSYNVFELYFFIFNNLGINNHILQTFTFSIIFLICPIFLLGQTIPLISNYFRHGKISSITGLILLVSTLGSCCGSVINTLIFFPYLGVNNTVIITIIAICTAVFIIEKRIISYNNIFAVFTILICTLINSLGFNNIINTTYSTIEIIENNIENSKILSINRSSSAKITQNPEDGFEYLQFINKRFINPLLDDHTKIYKILVIGAGGFTCGLQDNKNHYTYVDIDSSLKQVAEKHFLPQPLGVNKTFVAKPARVFIKDNNEKYDLIFLDVYTHLLSMPFQLITQEFFYSLKLMLDEGGLMLMNAITSPNFMDDFSIKLNNTINSIFPSCNREVVTTYNGWKNNPQDNVIYSCFDNKVNTLTYTDDKNSYFYDKSLFYE